MFISQHRLYYRSAFLMARADRKWLQRVVAACERGESARMSRFQIKLCKLALRNTA